MWLVINDLEAFYVRKMFDAALNRRGFTELIREMREAGIRGRNGSPIKYTQIYEILRNEKYAGINVYSVEGCRHRKTRLETQDAIRLDGAIPAIVDKNTFFEVQKIIRIGIVFIVTRLYPTGNDKFRKSAGSRPLCESADDFLKSVGLLT